MLPSFYHSSLINLSKSAHLANLFKTTSLLLSSVVASSVHSLSWVVVTVYVVATRNSQSWVMMTCIYCSTTQERWVGTVQLEIKHLCFSTLQTWKNAYTVIVLKCAEDVALIRGPSFQRMTQNQFFLYFSVSTCFPYLIRAFHHILAI